MKKLVFVVIWLLLSSTSAGAFQNEPDGFRDIKWGTDISTLKDMEAMPDHPRYGDIKNYRRKGNSLEIGDARLENISYGFWQGKLLGVRLVANEYPNCSRLKDSTMAKFGSGSKTNPYMEKYIWYGKVAKMMFEYDEISRMCALSIFSTEISNQQKEYDAKKAKEGADKGF